MGVLYALESIRTPALDKIMSVITLLGGELFFMVIAVTVFWCVSKREGYYLMIVGFFGTVINQFLKILCCVPRPWIKDPDFTIVESARAEATGYSFPSGHTQNAVATYGGIARYTRRGWLRVVLVVLTVLIAFSRMYLGVHTPLDVGVSFLIAAVLVLVVYPLMEEADRRPVVLTYTILAMVVCSGAFVGYLYLRGTPVPLPRTPPTTSARWRTAGSCWAPHWVCWYPTLLTGSTYGSRHRRCGGRSSSSWQWALAVCWPYAPG